MVATARDVSTLADLAAEERVLTAALDVTDDEQIRRAVQAAQERFGAVDVLVNNAGYGYRAAVEEGHDADVRRLIELAPPEELAVLVVPAVLAVLDMAAPVAMATAVLVALAAVLK